jgi:SPW repeat
MSNKFWQDWVMLAAAIWLFLSPFVLGFASATHPAAWFAWILSVFLIISVSEAIAFTDEIGEWLDSAIGLALLVAPMTLGLHVDSAPAINSVAVGLIVTACAISALIRDRKILDAKYGVVSE